jgi:hypothetical protein
LTEICAVAADAVLEVLAGVLAVVGTGVDEVGVDADELVLLDELPQPASASRLTARVSIESLDMERIFT